MADTQPDRALQLNVQGTQGASTGNAGRLTCQWCAVQLPAGEKVCPTCGSAGVPDTSMIVPGVSEEPSVSELDVEEIAVDELVEWWNEEAEVERQTYRNSAQRSDDPMPVILGLVGAGLFCIVAGVIGMPYMAPVIERNIGVVIEDPNDLRPIGGIIGLLAGLFIGAIGMWVSAPGK